MAVSIQQMKDVIFFLTYKSEETLKTAAVIKLRDKIHWHSLRPRLERNYKGRILDVVDSWELKDKGECAAGCRGTDQVLPLGC